MRSRAKGALIILGLVFFLANPVVRAVLSFPENVSLLLGHRRSVLGPLPNFLRLESDAPGLRLQGGALEAGRSGSYRLELVLFHRLPLRQATLDVLPPLKVYPGGQSIGVRLKHQGVLVVEEEPVWAGRGPVYPARKAGLRSGDVILAVDGKRLEGKEELASRVEEGRPLELEVFRRGSVAQVRVTPVYDLRRRRYLLGLWVRDAAQGLGTLSFYLPSLGVFAALGHEISDDSGRPLPLAGGVVVPAPVTAVRPGRPGAPGEKLGFFRDEVWGIISSNSSLGLTGWLERIPPPDSPPLPVALPEEIAPGPATLLTVIAGEEKQAFGVVIEKVFSPARPGEKAFVVRVSDRRLLSATGGIVQGMSGSPIIQKGKIVGVLTHVFLQDPSRGYGIPAFWIYKEALLSAR